MRIHIHDHEINQGRRILELNQHIFCYPIVLHQNGVCQSQLMRGRDQWVLIEAVLDHLMQDVHGSSPIIECMMDLDWPQDTRNCLNKYRSLPIDRTQQSKSIQLLFFYFLPYFSFLFHFSLIRCFSHHFNLQSSRGSSLSTV
jgi:hypothetical protein